MDAQTLHIDFVVPKGWHELSDTQLRYVYSLIAKGLTSDELAVLCLLRWSDTHVIGRQPSGAYLLRHKRQLFEVEASAVAALLPHLAWLHDIPSQPIRFAKIGRQKALPADFQGVPFETFIVCDNLYQGFLQTQQDELLDQLAAVLYDRKLRLSPAERISIFYWMAALKQFFSRRFSDFFQPLAGADGNQLASPNIGQMLQEAMDAQIRALTKGDITKESEILALDTWRALTELNAQAREYKQLQAHLKK